MPALCLLIAGCGGGGGGGGGGIAPMPAASIREVAVEASGADAFAVDFRVTPVSEALRVTLEYSEDCGMTFRASVSPESQVVLDEGVESGRIIWRAAEDIGASPQGDLVVRVTPRGVQSETAGTPAVSLPFAYGANSPPSVAWVAPASLPAGSPAAIVVAAADPEGDAVVIFAAYSTDGGRTFTPADTWGPVRLAPEGTTAQFRWDAFAALGEGEFEEVLIKAVARDAASEGERVSAPFDLVTLRPRVTGITVEGVPLTMNGSAPFTNLAGEEEAYRLLVPACGFTLQVFFAPHEKGAAIDPSSLRVTTACPLGPAGETPAGTDFGSLFLAGEEEAALAIPERLAFPPGRVAVYATIADRLGNTSEACAYEFTAESGGEAFHPFAKRDAWGIDLARDNWTTAASCVNGTVTITTAFAPNGTPDFIDDLALIGLYDARHAAEGERVAALVKDRLVAELYGFYTRPDDGVLAGARAEIEFTLSALDATSMIGVGGADPAGGYTLGRALFDRGNARFEYNATAGLGIFGTNLIRFYINSSFTFRSLFDPFIPGRGRPVGTAPEDARVLSDEFIPGDAANTAAEEARYDAIVRATAGFARALAAIAAHEIGHSVGLVANGPPPFGLFGGEKNAEFAGRFTDPYHLDTPGNNIMESAMSFTVMQYTDWRALAFNPLAMAYLLEKALVKR
ncbi:MAG TPA: hypothetical protein DCM87_14125 [Planctomycetes bacterium]|nr:hypothetical protein [Planctomycetota bacterium]